MKKIIVKVKTVEKPKTHNDEVDSLVDSFAMILSLAEGLNALDEKLKDRPNKKNNEYKTNELKNAVDKNVDDDSDNELTCIINDLNYIKMYNAMINLFNWGKLHVESDNIHTKTISILDRLIKVLDSTMEPSTTIATYYPIAQLAECMFTEDKEMVINIYTNITSKLIIDLSLHNVTVLDVINELKVIRDNYKYQYDNILSQYISIISPTYGETAQITLSKYLAIYHNALEKICSKTPDKEITITGVLSNIPNIENVYTDIYHTLQFIAEIIEDELEYNWLMEIPAKELLRIIKKLESLVKTQKK